MLFYSLPTTLTPFPAISYVKGNVDNERNPRPCPFQVIAFINEGVTGCINEEIIDAINEATIVAIITGRNPRSCFLFDVLLFHQHHQLIDVNFLAALQI